MLLYKSRRNFGLIREVKTVVMVFDGVIKDDNQVCLLVVQKDRLLEFTEHVDLNGRSVIDFIRNSDVRAQYVSLKQMVVDIVTKCLATQRLLVWWDSLGMGRFRFA